MAKSERGEASTSDIQAVDRVAQICGLFGANELTAADVAELTGLNRTTAYRYCASMTAAGILERGSRRGTFALGGLMLQIGIQALGRRRVVDIAPSHLSELRDAVGMTTVLSLWAAGRPVVALVEEDASRGVMITVRPGTRLDETAAQTHVYLAYAGDDAVAAAAKGLRKDDTARLLADVERARGAGYSVVGYDGGMFGAAAPVFDQNGICATIAVLGATQLADLSETSPALGSLRATAAAVSAELGGAIPSPTD
ncbi:IclR family transcriptional regulator [Microbacterium elymi]|uniref:Helix-turn-helix domain-containing protein n=1 Tax=Microbacterium elymi TaxID=2909587 RepID=A0ABY5NMQ3_9MICO|nr:helix-turn-helix domain-containing protein [Microbacterium elymi]UUT36469.1 helix-turn-helix domain-containing protein [Microbacterium elymi]